MRKNKSTGPKSPTRHNRKVEQNNKSPHNLGWFCKDTPHIARLGFVRGVQGLVLFWHRSLPSVNEDDKTKA